MRVRSLSLARFNLNASFCKSFDLFYIYLFFVFFFLFIICWRRRRWRRCCCLSSLTMSRQRLTAVQLLRNECASNFLTPATSSSVAMLIFQTKHSKEKQNEARRHDENKNKTEKKLFHTKHWNNGQITKEQKLPTIINFLIFVLTRRRFVQTRSKSEIIFRFSFLFSFL